MVRLPGRKILCELKRDYHAKVWTAAEESLNATTGMTKRKGSARISCSGLEQTDADIPVPPDGLANPWFKRGTLFRAALAGTQRRPHFG